ncbi:family A G protein-coupled receptor-like protein [Poronia punctata]|nr:family A G protein-coupled receptor-like protein [Poronia punctata]
MPTPLTPGVLRAITTIERVGSVFSLLGCVFIIVTFTTSTAFHKPINRLVFYASFGNMLTNVATLIARAYVGHPDSAGCQLQGFLIQQFLPADALWTLAMALNVYLTFYHRYDAEKLKKMEIWYLLVCYGLPLPLALGFIFISNASRGRIYGDATLWCWVTPRWEVLRVATFYGPVWLVILATFFIYIRAGREIYQKRRQLRALGNSSRSAHDVETTTINADVQPTKTTEITVTSESVEGTELQDASPLRTLSTRSETKPQPAGTYSIMISSDHLGRAAQEKKDTPTTSGKTRRRQNNEAGNAAWSYTKCAILFFTALLVTWIPSSANRVYSLVHGDDTVVALQVLSAIVLPLQGFWNAIIYAVTSWHAVKLFFSELGSRKRNESESTRYPGPYSDIKLNFSFNFKGRNRGGKVDDTDSTVDLAGNARSIDKSL